MVTAGTASTRRRLGLYFLVAVLLPLIAGMLATAIIVDQHLAGLPTAVAMDLRTSVRGCLILSLGAGALAALGLAELAGRQVTVPLKRLADALAQSKATLESRVRERTSELEAARHELEDKSRRAEEADRLKSAFIANMSHEIRTPLNSVLALSVLLRDGTAGPLTADQRDYLEVIERNGHNLLRLLNDILDLSRIEAGHLEMDTQDVDVAPHVCDIGSTLAPLATAKGLDLTLKIPEQLPLVRADVDRVRQILTNLVGNAIKFTDAGTVQVGVDVRPAAIALQVTDTGIGIPEAQLDKIFHEFVQVDQTLARRQGGTGLGLAIARRLARLMGGEVSVTSIAGKGSRFTLTLPRAIGAAPERPLPAPTRTARLESRKSGGDGHADADGDRGRPGVSTTGRALVLIVEDNEDNLFTLRQILAPLSLDNVTATNGRQAIAQCRRQMPDLVIMDMQLPGMSGLQATGAIRALPGGARVPIIALTAQAMKGDRERILAAGCDEYLAKPVQPNALRAMVARLVGADDAAGTGAASGPPAAW
jgi:signal transduction histidine kinase/CheY-like chemotaxis protein